jgi:hypothetical protein
MRPTVEMPKKGIIKHNATTRKGEKVVQIYIYSNVVWIKDKGPRYKRTYLGREEVSTGRLIPNDNYYKLYPTTDHSNVVQELDAGSYEDLSFGDFYVLKTLEKRLKLEQCLNTVFGQKSQDLLFLVHCLLRNENSIEEINEWAKTAYSFTKWKINYDPQFAFDLFSSISDSQISSFFSNWIEVHGETDSIAYEITSTTSSKDNLKLAEYGYNSDREVLNQINLVVLNSSIANRALLYEVDKGSKSEKNLLATFLENCHKYNLKPKRYVFNRGLITKGELEDLENNDVKYITRTEIDYSFVRQELEKLGNLSSSYSYRLDKYELYGTRIPLNESRFLYLFLNSNRKENDIYEMKLQIKNIQTKLEEGDELTSEEIWIAEQYFDLEVDKLTNIAVKWQINNEKVQAQFSSLGYFAYLANELLELDEVIDLYQERLKVELNYNNLHHDRGIINKYRPHDRTMQGKIFVAFIASILRSKISEAIEFFKLKYEKMSEKQKKEVVNPENDNVKNILASLAGLKVHLEFRTNLSRPHHSLTKKELQILTLLGIDPEKIIEVLSKVVIY